MATRAVTVEVPEYAYRELQRRAAQSGRTITDEVLAEVALAYLLGEDEYGRWLGVASGNPWQAADYSRSGVFDSSFVKLVPNGTFWTACFNRENPAVDVDIVLPVRWIGDALEEVDLELDILRSADGSVHVRDREEFECVRKAWTMPEDIVAQAETTCERLCALVERGGEPFGAVGRAWLSRFLAEIEAPRP